MGNNSKRDFFLIFDAHQLENISVDLRVPKESQAESDTFWFEVQFVTFQIHERGNSEMMGVPSQKKIIKYSHYL